MPRRCEDCRWCELPGKCPKAFQVYVGKCWAWAMVEGTRYVKTITDGSRAEDCERFKARERGKGRAK